MKKQYRGEIAEEWGLGKFADLRGVAWQEREGVF